MVVWLGNWLVDWSIGWLIGQLIGWLVGWPGQEGAANWFPVEGASFRKEAPSTAGRVCLGGGGQAVTWSRQGGGAGGR